MLIARRLVNAHETLIIIITLASIFPPPLHFELPESGG